MARKKKTPLEPDPATVHERITPLECKSCFSHRAGILKDGRAQCADCLEIYDIKTFDATPCERSAKSKELETKRRKTKIDYRNEIDPAPPPDLPTATTLIDQALAAGPPGIRNAQRLALRTAKRFAVQLEDHWRRPTDWLKALESQVAVSPAASAQRACARFALQWRPKFLATLSVTRSPILAAHAAHIAKDTANEHRRQDKQFDAQCREAIDDATELLHSRAYQRALEGDCEPIHYMGVIVGYVRKFDSRLQIELLRAYRPDQFKTPGVNLNLGVRGDVFILTEEQRHELMAINREYLESTPIPQVGVEQPQALTNGDHGEANH